MSELLPILSPILGPVTSKLTDRGSGFSPASLFAGGQQGAWYDPSDLSTLFQDSLGTTPVTATGQPVGMMMDKSGNANHAIQATASARPLLQKDANGRYYLQSDGVDDAMTTPVVTSAAGFHAIAIYANFANNYTALASGAAATNEAGIAIKTRSTGVVWARKNSAASGTAGDVAASGASTFTATTPLVCAIDYGTSAVAIRVNGTSTPFTSALNAASANTIFLMRGLSIAEYLNGRTYGAILLSRAAAASESASIERFLANRSGAAVP